MISFGFDPDDPDAGPFLDPISPQGEYAKELLSLTEEVLLEDANYVARLERHYALVKAAVNDPTNPVHARVVEARRHRRGPPQVNSVRTAAKVGRNDPCPCGSGKKLKRCCAKAPALS